MIILGITDTVNTCDCCGKKNLKCTVAIQMEDGGIVYYGTTCAASKHGVKTSMKSLNEIASIKKAAKTIQEFIKAIKGRGYSSKVLSPIFDNVSAVTWVWGDVKVCANDF